MLAEDYGIFLAIQHNFCYIDLWNILQSILHSNATSSLIKMWIFRKMLCSTVWMHAEFICKFDDDNDDVR